MSSLTPSQRRRAGHTCHARGCDTNIPRKLFMCPAHWRRLPRSLQNEIWEAYTEGQEDNLSLVTDAYLKVTTRAVNLLARLDGLTG